MLNKNLTAFLKELRIILQLGTTEFLEYSAVVLYLTAVIAAWVFVFISIVLFLVSPANFWLPFLVSCFVIIIKLGLNKRRETNLHSPITKLVFDKRSKTK